MKPDEEYSILKRVLENRMLPIAQQIYPTPNRYVYTIRDKHSSVNDYIRYHIVECKRSKEGLIHTLQEIINLLQGQQPVFSYMGRVSVKESFIVMTTLKLKMNVGQLKRV